MKEFLQLRTPDAGRSLTEIYTVQHRRGNALDPVARVTVGNIQRLPSMLRGGDGRRASTTSTSIRPRRCSRRQA